MKQGFFICSLMLLLSCASQVALTKAQIYQAKSDDPAKSCLVYFYTAPPLFHGIKSVTLSHRGDDIRNTQENAEIVFFGVQPGEFRIKQLTFEYAGNSTIDGYMGDFSGFREQAYECKSGAMWLGAFQISRSGARKLAESEAQEIKNKLTNNLIGQLQGTNWVKLLESGK